MSARSEVIRDLKQFSDRSVELLRVVRNVSMGEGNAESPEGVMKQLIATDSSLQDAVALLRQNQEFQKKIDAVHAKIRSREAAVADLAVQLKSAETILQQALDETALAVAAIKQSQQNQGRINVHTLINYSAKVAETSGKMQGANTKEPFPSVEAFQHARLFKELVNKKSDLQTTIENLESETQYQSFLGDLTTTTTAENDEELADF